jgi:hypothetical protein
MATTAIRSDGRNGANIYDVRSLADQVNVVTAATVVSAPAVITAYTAHAAGSTTVTSNAATDLDTTAAAVATLEDEVTALRLTVSNLMDALVTAGVIALT